MKKALSLLASLLFFACANEQIMITPENALKQLDTFQQKKKFEADEKLFYPGLVDEKLRPILTKLINQAATDFKTVATSPQPTNTAYWAKIKLGLNRFSTLEIGLDTEERERICSYFEELMDIVGLESSNGQLNTFMYGFDPS